MSSDLKRTFEGKSVFLTGHTGFKGAWMSLWLSRMGAEVHGYSLDEKDPHGLFRSASLANCIGSHFLGDLLDEDYLEDCFEKADPDFVFHFAAQPLVRDSYRDPRSTYASNVTGTINLLELLRSSSKPCVAIFVTSDKCYENVETGSSFKETDALGGFDPYSSSKACCEIIVSSWRNSFFASKDKIRIATVRAGNVIGGGDWSKDRIIPDAIRSLSAKKEIPVRNPSSVRPWQHVLDPIYGYLKLAHMIEVSSLGSENSINLCSAFNFGPDEYSQKTVMDLILEVLKHWKGNWVDSSNPNDLHESKLLRLDIDKAASCLNWQPVWGFEQLLIPIDRFLYCLFESPKTLLKYSFEQINLFELASKKRTDSFRHQ